MMMLPNFAGSFLEIDPSFSVLLGGDTSGCATLLQESKVDAKIYIAVFVSIGGALIIGLFMVLLVAPRIRLWMAVRGANIVEMGPLPTKSSRRSGGRSGRGGGEDDINIERAAPMEVFTSAGKFSLELD